MRLGLVKPYFTPYLNHFRMMTQYDHWILFDIVVCRRRTWMNRNRIANMDSGWSYISASVESPSRTDSGSGVPLANLVSWRADLLNQLHVYENRAP